MSLKKVTIQVPVNEITLAEVLSHRYGCRFEQAVQQHKRAADALMALLNEPLTQLFMVRGGGLKPIIPEIEADALIRTALPNTEFRKMVGFLALLVLAGHGMVPTGSKTTMVGAQYFKRCEIYKLGRPAAPSVQHYNK